MPPTTPISSHSPPHAFLGYCLFLSLTLCFSLLRAVLILHTQLGSAHSYSSMKDSHNFPPQQGVRQIRRNVFIISLKASSRWWLFCGYFCPPNLWIHLLTTKSSLFQSMSMWCSCSVQLGRFRPQGRNEVHINIV